MGTEFELKLLALIGQMQNDINNLKQEVNELKQEVTTLKAQPYQNDTEHHSDENRITINEVREHIKKELILHYPYLKFTNGRRNLGKLTISDGNETVDQVLIRTSKSFREKEGYPSGWITFHQDLLTKYELYFFVVKDFQSNLHVFVMHENDILQWIANKRVDANGNYHFYMNLIDGRWIDDREANYDFSRFYENWEVVNDMLSNRH